jgi:transcriptional regulator with XRE-family HTH domain
VSTPRHPINTALRDAIASRRISAYRLAKAAAVDARNIRRWLLGEQDLSLASADRLAVALGLRVTEAPARKGGHRAASLRVAIPLLDQLGDEDLDPGPGPEAA